jgi:hypothetical protein
MNLAQAIDPVTRRIRVRVEPERGSSGFTLAELLERRLALKREHLPGSVADAEAALERRREAGARLARLRAKRAPAAASQPRVRSRGVKRKRVLEAIKAAGRRMTWKELTRAASVRGHLLLQMVAGGALDRTGARRHYRYGPPGMPK